MTKNISKWSALILLFFIIYNMPLMNNCSQNTKLLFCVYIFSILGIVIQPIEETTFLIISISFNAILIGTETVVSGFSTNTVWLVLCAFIISLGFSKSGIGSRISYHLIGIFGKSTLHLCYVMAVIDMILSPAIPSNTARSGGITYPIFSEVMEVLENNSNLKCERFRAYLTLMQGYISFSTSAMFITACVPNIIAVDYAKKILGLSITWLDWTIAMLIPNLIVLICFPYILYKIYPPEIKGISISKQFSSTGLKKIGKMKKKEKILMIIFLSSIFGWILGPYINVNSTNIALLFVSFLLIFKIITIDDILSYKKAWNTFLWIGFIMSLSDSLMKTEIFEKIFKTIKLDGFINTHNTLVMLLIVIVFSLIIRYFFVSMTAYVTIAVPFIFMIFEFLEVSHILLFYMIAGCTSYGCGLTHYGGTLSSYLYGTGNVEKKLWWKYGLIFSIFNLVVYFSVGMFFWKIINIW